MLVALRQAYLSWERLRERLEVRGYVPTSGIFWFKWPVRTCRFVATLLQNRRVLWLDLDILCPGRQLGRGRFAREQAALEYLLNVGGADWAYLVTIAAIPALLFALWGAKRAHRRLHAVAQERLLEQDGPLQQAT